MKFLAVFLFFSISLVAHSASQKYFAYGCNIADEDGNIVRAYMAEGTECAYFKNGDILIQHEKSVSYHNKNMELLWSKNISPHHEVNFTSDEKYILVIALEQHHFFNQDVFFDVIYKLDRKGNVVAKWDTFSHWKDLEKRRFYERYDLYSDDFSCKKKNLSSLDDDSIDICFRRNSFALKLTNGDGSHSLYEEFSHINAVHEIPRNKLEKNPILKKGNIIVTMNAFGAVAIFDPNFTKILYWKRFNDIFHPAHQIHDAQILSNGNILVFNNINFSTRFDSQAFDASIDVESPALTCHEESFMLVHYKYLTYSNVLEINPLSSKIEWLYQAYPMEQFYVRKGGNAQSLENGAHLISIRTNDYNESDSNGAIIINKAGKVIKQLKLKKHGMANQNKFYSFMLRIRLLDLQSFLDNNNGG